MKYLKSKKITFILLTLFELIALVILLFLTQFQRNNNKSNEIISRLIGTKIVLPQTAIVKGTMPISVDSVINQSDYRIITYIDTTYCYSCRLQLNKWKEFLSEVSDEKRTVMLFLIFNSSIQHEAENLLEIENWEMPIIYDTNEQFKNTYNIPKEFALQTLLLNSKNEVISVGNPIFYPKINDYYKKMMNVSSVKLQNTEVRFSKKKITLEKMQNDSTYEDQIILYNIGKKKLKIIDISTTCNCIETSSSSLIANAGDSIIVYVKYKANNRKTLSDKIYIKSNTEPQLNIVKVEGDF